jgi:hypothetical protein
MPSPTDYVLFTAADPGIYSNTLKDFENHLVNNVLFEEKLLIQDGYLVNSDLLFQHLANTNRGRSLFEMAAVNGLIVPAYRQPGTSSLSNAVSIMEKDYGEKVRLQVQQCDPVLTSRLYECIDKGAQAFYWPPSKEGIHLGEEYGKLLRKELQNEEHMKGVLATGDKPALAELWEKTRPLRTDLIDRAEENTRNKGRWGIQRSEIVLLLLDYCKVEDINQLLAEHPLKRLAMTFLRWTTHCHQLNMSRIFGSSIHLLEYEPDEDFIPNHVLAPIDPYPVMDSEPLICEVSLPKPQLLLGYFKQNLDSLLDIRRELGKEYLSALHTWRDTPTWQNKDFVAQRLQEYCREICKYYLKNTEPQKWIVQLTNGMGYLMDMASSSIHGVLATVAYKEGTKKGLKILSGSFHLNTTLNPSIRKTDLHIYHPKGANLLIKPHPTTT